MNYEAHIVDICSTIRPPDEAFGDVAWARLDSLTKPPRSLGRLEELAAQVAIVQREVRPDVSRRAIVVMAGDHGVVAEGVAAYPQEVTVQMVANFAAGGAAVCQLARHAGAELVVVDVGVAGDVSALDGVRHAKVAAGTRNLAVGPAMTREQAAEAVWTGVEVARELATAGVALVGVGEMGIGNTTAAAALTAALTGSTPATVVGPGTGLDSEGVARKADVVARGLGVNSPDPDDQLGVLAALGGLEIAGMTGVVLGCASAGVCVVSDGFISGSAALVGVRMCPAAAGYVFPSHRSAEPGHRIVLEALGLEPVLELDMRLGEGTGAALAIDVIAAACEVMSGMATFAEAGVSEAGE